jgi:hypothetical protein
LGRQTDGLRRVVSNDAIFDRDFGFHPVRSFPAKNGTEVRGGGQGCEPGGRQKNRSRAKETTGLWEKGKAVAGFAGRDRPSNPFHLRLKRR